MRITRSEYTEVELETDKIKMRESCEQSRWKSLNKGKWEIMTVHSLGWLEWIRCGKELRKTVSKGKLVLD